MLLDVTEHINKLTETLSAPAGKRELVKEIAKDLVQRYALKLSSKEERPPRDVAIVSVYMACTKVGLKKEEYQSLVSLGDVGALLNIYQDMNIRINTH